jgi:pyridoxine 5-phosphate synthase
VKTFMTESPNTPQIKLGVNLDHVATLRQARRTLYPDPLQAAFAAQDAGADNITVHLREDRRHIQERDVELLRRTLTIPLNLEMAATTAIRRIALRLRPAECCLVPERRQELTTEGGLDAAGQIRSLREYCARLGEAGIAVSLFIDPDKRQIEAACAIGAPIVELHTGSYAEAANAKTRARELRRLAEAAIRGLDAGLSVHAGHGLQYHNVQEIAAIPGIRCLNIGHAIVARAIMTGMAEAVREMKRLMVETRRRSP